jgi:ribosomal protein L29
LLDLAQELKAKDVPELNALLNELKFPVIKNIK